MKILQAIPYFNPKFGGDFNVCINLSKELEKRKHDVTIITTDFDFDTEYAKTMKEIGINVIPIHCLAHFGLFLYSPSMSIWLEKNLENFDIVHLHNYRSYQNVLIHKLAMKQGIPYILLAQGSVLPLFEKQKLKKLYDFVWGKRILSNAAKCIGVSKIEKEQYLKMGVPENKIDIIPNGIDVSEYETLPKRGRFRKKIGIGSDEKIILYLGRLHKRKGLEFLLAGFSNMLNHYKGIKLVIAGPNDGILDTLKKQIRKYRIENDVLITGQLYKNDKLEAFVDANLLVYPGILEIFGLVPFEAIMCGTPVIVSDDCGCGEIIKDAQCGYVVHFGDVDGLTSLMCEVLANPQDADEKVKSGQLYIQGYLSYDKVTDMFLKVYKTCSANKTNC